MSKSKIGYRVYNGKVLKKFFENSRVYFLAATFAVGLAIGAVAIKGNKEILMKISELADSFVFSRSQQGITENFFDSFSVGIIFNAFNIFLGFSLIGYPLIIWLPFLRGMGLGTLSGYLYSVYRFTGLGYCALTVYPAAIVSTLAFVLACNDSCEYSKNAFAKAVKGRGQFEKDETKVYLIRQLIFIAVCALSSVADAVFTALFSGLFEI